ncbi:MAG TPA: T9SS type A sorting domain-containing protein [Fibrobacteraceae bacterium]|nr:T9SS type A sorting domain-containing protein [Fibrobacteraceae bacterium]
MTSKISTIFFLSGLSLASFSWGDSFKWGSVSMGGGGFVSAIVASQVDENLFYARTDVGGAYRWDESSSQWVSLMDWVDVSERGLLGVEAIAADPTTSGTVYMVTGTSYWNDGRTAFLRSTNKGDSWEVIYTWDSTGVKTGAIQKFKAHGNGMGRGNGEALAIDPNNSSTMFYGSKNKGLFKSSSNGNDWTHVDAFTTAAGYDTTWNGSGFSFVTFSPGSSDTLYAGFLRDSKNVFRSTDGGASWSVLTIPDSLVSTSGGTKLKLMPQRAVISSDGGSVFITFADGAGPHTMEWDEGWGMIYDGFGRGAVLKYDVTNATWSDVSPEDFIDDGDTTGTSAYEDSSDLEAGSYKYIAPYGGISINPNNSDEIVVSTMGYRGPQFWYIDGSWEDKWGTNIYRSTDGGATWAASFRYYWTDGGYYPTTEQMSDNGVGWMEGGTIHWSGSVVIDPFNDERIWVTSGNGVFATSNASDYEVIEAGTYDTAASYYYSDRTVNNSQIWKFMAQGIEETVPEEVVSIPGGPLISVIGDYDGFRHDDICEYPSQRHQTSVSGTYTSLGSTRGLAYAPLSGKLVKVSDARVYEGTYNDVPIDPIQFSSDSGTTWTVATYGSLDTSYKKGDVAISADGSVVLWQPGSGTTTLYRYSSGWSTTSLSSVYPVGDPADADIFYAYDYTNGVMYKSTDAGASFSTVASPGVSSFRKFRMAPGRSGDLWVPVTVSDADTGSLMRSTDAGASFSAVSGVTYCEAVGFGKSATDDGYPAVYIFGTVNDVKGVFQSDDEGVTWTRVNDDAHEYGGLANGEFVVGDMNTYGVVYMSTAGRGIAARVPSDWSLYTSSTDASVALDSPLKEEILADARIAQGQLYLNVSSTILRVQVFDLKGTKLYSGTFSSSTQIPLRSILPAQGTYLLQVRSASKTLLTRQISRI